MKEIDYNFVLRVFQATMQLDYCGFLSWQTWVYGKPDEPMIFSVDVSDCFYSAGSNSEYLTPDNIDIFESSIADINALGDRSLQCHVPKLFVAKIRKTKPIDNWGVEFANEKFMALFDACEGEYLAPQTH